MITERPFLRYFIPALGLFVLLRFFFFDFATVKDKSMEPGLESGDILLVARAAYALRLPFGGDALVNWGHPEQGDVIILTAPGLPGKLVKRVVAVGGDRLSFYRRTLLVNGTNVRFFSNRLVDPFDGKTVTVPKNHVFVLGDNSDNSMDSMDFGAIGRDRILGRAVFRVLPLSKAGKVPVSR